MKYMLDTNICIYAIKHKPKTVIDRIKNQNLSDLCISSVTYAELVHGVEKSQAVERNRIALMLMLAGIEVLDFDSHAAETYGKIRATLEKKGCPIGPLDMMIAGHCMSTGCTLVSNNTGEFSRIENLKLENWT